MSNNQNLFITKTNINIGFGFSFGFAQISMQKSEETQLKRVFSHFCRDVRTKPKPVKTTKIFE